MGSPLPTILEIQKAVAKRYRVPLATMREPDGVGVRRPRALVPAAGRHDTRHAAYRAQPLSDRPLLRRSRSLDRDPLRTRSRSTRLAQSEAPQFPASPHLGVDPQMSRPATSKPKCNAIMGELPVLQYCAVEQLKVDDSYQRSLEATNSITLIRRIAMYWDWGLCQPLYVSRRADHGLYVVDGQHRLAAARLRADIWQLPCVVRSFDSAEQEAAAFVALNQERRPLNKLQIFKAAIAAGDFEAAQIVKCVEEAGLSIASSTNIESCPEGALSSIGGLQHCYRVHGVQVLTAALDVLAQSYKGQVLRYAGTLFPGIAAIVAAEMASNPNFADSDQFALMTEMIGGASQAEWVRDVNQRMTDGLANSRRQAAGQVFEIAWAECTAEALDEAA
jgi:hypothetical protein